MEPVLQQSPTAAIDSQVVRLVLAGALGLFLGLEREWSQKSAGIRTFSLISLAGAVFTLLAAQTTYGWPLLFVGGLLITAQGVLLAVRGLLSDGEDGLALTTSTSMLVAYGVGALVASDLVLEGVAVAVLSSLVLVLKRELHSFAENLSREEVRSGAEFAIIAFVVYPLLPAGERQYSIPMLGLDSLTIEPRVVWLMVVTVAGIGILNYVIVQLYGGRGIAVTGFFGGLASSTAVVGTMLDHVRQNTEAASYAAAAILLADAAMALRNLLIVVAFTFSRGVLIDATAPLVAVIITGIVVAAFTADWSENVDITLDSPFSLRYALGFGGMFLVVLVVGSVANAQFGAAGFLATAVASGLVSSAGATTSAVLLFRGGTLSAETTVLSVLLATASSVVVKAGLTAVSPNRSFSRRVAIYSAVLVTAGGVVTALVVLTA
ncbi:MgtC/SapB family protein [Haloarchaeobius sp. DYHT-AS-18]|uniref:MgtC/SapB family protein n=1 Tax=Haloarchaeobius sp. DYHT-AS-18 TaxID=3446117 RepID=UPI003EBC62E6